MTVKVWDRRGGGWWFGTEQAPQPALPMGWQLTESNTGIAKHGLTIDDMDPWTGSSTLPAGTYTRRLFTSGLNIHAGVVLDQCLIRPNSATAGFPIVSTSGGQNGDTPAAVKSTLIDTTMDCSHLSAETIAKSSGLWGIADVYGCLFKGMGTGIALLQTGPTLSSTIEGTYVTGLRSFGDPAGSGSHNSAATIRGFAPAAGRVSAWKRCRLDLSAANASAGLFVQTYESNIGGLVIEDCYIEGGGYNLYLENHSGKTYSNIAATNNRFRPTGYAAFYRNGVAPVTWSGNYLYNAANPPTYQGAAVAA